MVTYKIFIIIDLLKDALRKEISLRFMLGLYKLHALSLNITN